MPGNDDGARAPMVRRAVAVTTLLLLVGWGLWVGFALIHAARDAGAGVDLARSGADAASEGDLKSPKPIEDLRRAQARFASAEHSLRSLPVRAAGVLPVVGRNVREVRALSASAAALSAVSADTLTKAQAVLQGEHTTPAQRVETLRALGQVATEGAQRMSAVPRPTGHDLAAPVRHRHDDFVREADRAQSTLERAAAGATAMADLLGGPRRYVILAANNAEMRAGSGMFNTIGGLETAEGKLTLLPFVPASDITLPPPGAPVTGDYAARWGWLEPGREWRNLGVSPRFDQTAPIAAQMWELTGRGHVDGVLAVDPLFLSGILEAVGPIDAGGLHLDSENVIGRILHDQYDAHAGDPPDQRARREELGLVAKAVFGALESRSWDPGALAHAVAGVAQGRHVLAWSSRPEEQHGWEAAGISGELYEDSLLLSVLNRGGNKLDQFLAVDATLECTRGAAKGEGVLRVHLRNDVPTGEPAYVAGPDPHSGVGEGVYIGYLTVNLPAAATRGRIDGVDNLVVAGADGPTHVIGAEVKLARGEERTLTVRFDLPAGPGSLVVEPSARVPAPKWTAQGGREKWTDRSQTVVW